MTDRVCENPIEISFGVHFVGEANVGEVKLVNHSGNGFPLFVQHPCECILGQILLLLVLELVRFIHLLQEAAATPVL